MQLISNGHQLIASVVEELGSDCNARRDLVSGFRMGLNQNGGRWTLRLR